MAELLEMKLQTVKFQRTERDEYGTIRENITKFIENNKNVKKACCVPVNAKNVRTMDKQMLLVIREVHPTKKNLAETETIYVGKAISDMVRTGEISLSAVLDFPVILHRNNFADPTTGEFAEYMLVVRPTSGVSVEDQEKVDKMVLFADTEVTAGYDNTVVDVEDVLNQMVVY